MCEDQKLPGIKAYTIAACHDYCKQKYIAEKCKCQAFYMKGRMVNIILIFKSVYLYLYLEKACSNLHIV